MNGDKDDDLMNNNPDLDFYLTTPNGNLRVDRNSTNGQRYSIADGLPRDETKYGPYKKGEHGYDGKIYPYLDRIDGPSKNTDDLLPVGNGPPPSRFNNGIREHSGSAGPAGKAQLDAIQATTQDL
jgi:hypothetical protein